MRAYGLVLESYGKYVKVRTKDGEFIVRSDKKPPKEGTKIEVKDFGKGDYLAKVVAKKPGEFEELPNVKFVEISERITSGLKFKHMNTISVAVALFLEEISKRIEISNPFILRIQKLLSGKDLDDEDRKFERYLNVLSGRYGLKSDSGTIIFMDRKTSTFHVFLEANKIFGKVEDGIQNSVVLYFEKFPENVQYLEESLRKHFQIVSIKLEGFSEGAYV